MMKYISILFFLTALCGAQKDLDQQHLGWYNMLQNPGAENGLAKMAVSSATLTKETSNPLFGSTSFKIDSTADGDYVKTVAVAIPEGLYGRDCEVSAVYDVESGFTAADYSLIASDGSNDLVSVDFAVVDNATQIYAAFACPTSGNLELRIESNTANGKYLIVDGLWLGSNRHNFDYSTAELVGSIQWDITAGCEWNSTAGGPSNFSDDNDCDDNARTVVGNITDSSSGVRPAFGLPTVEPGNYLVIVSGKMGIDSAGATTDVKARYRLYDGSTQYGAKVETQIKAPSGTLKSTAPNMQFDFKIETATTISEINIQFETQGTNAKAIVDATTDQFKISVYRFPLASQKAVSVDTSPMYWSGVHANDCSFSESGGSFVLPTGDASCTFTETDNKNFGTVTSIADGTGNQPGLTFTPRIYGHYYICAQLANRNKSDDSVAGYRIYFDSSEIAGGMTTSYRTNSMRICGFGEVSSLSPKNVEIRMARNTGIASLAGSVALAIDTVKWVIFPITQQLPQAYLLPKHKYQIRYLQDDCSSNTDSNFNDIAFSNLTVGKYYRVGGIIRYRSNMGATDNNIEMYLNHNGNVITRIEDSDDRTNNVGTIGVNVLLQAEATTLTWDGGSLSGNSYIDGDGTREQTWISLEELEYYEETSEFTP